MRLVPGAPVLACLWTLACAAPEVGSHAAPLDAPRRLVPDAVLFAAPEGGDGPSLRLHAWERADGTREPSGLPPAVFAQAQGDDVVLLTREGRLLRFVGGDPERGEVLAREVRDAPALADDALAYVVTDEMPGGVVSVLHRVADGRDLVLDRSLYALGNLRFAPDGRTVLGVGSVNGGIAGWHAFDESGARCLTNCGLRVGSAPETWTPIEEPEVDGDTLRFGDHVIRWRLR